MLKLDEFLTHAWKSYSELTPDAPLIHSLLELRGETTLNDHVAFRTFDLPGLSRLELGRVFEAWGYRDSGEELDFPEKKLKASYWLHPDQSKPKIFVSELLTAKVSSTLQSWIRDIAKPARKLSPEFFLEKSWNPPTHSDYERFYEESEYAAWTAAFGIRVNHFTVLVNSLKTFDSLQALNAFLLENGIVLNASGGLVKGTPQELLEQSSTQARKVPHRFADRTAPVMGCYYEFARRYPLPGTRNGFFQGFLPKSADKIFESTFERRK
jgi:hypothetical protein